MSTRLISGNLLRVRQDTSSSSSTTGDTSTTSSPGSSVPDPLLEAAFSLRDGYWARTYVFGKKGAYTVLSGPFTGNTQGFDYRNTIFGTPRYGSGFQLGDPARLDVQNHFFPYGFWPIYWGKSGYGGSSSYYDNEWRPGGFQAVVPITIREYQWFILGDADTIQIMNTILARNRTEGGCEAKPIAASIYRFDPDSASPLPAVDLPPDSIEWMGFPYYRWNGGLNPTTSPLDVILKPENAIQWYRGSSFALLDPLYINQAALNNNIAPVSTANTALNMTASQTDVFKCVNETIGASIPIFDSSFTVATFETTPGWHKQDLKPGIIAAIVILSVLGLGVYTVGLLWFGRRLERRRSLSLQRKKGSYESVKI